MIPEDLLQHSFTMVTAQFWELMADSRLITIHTNLHRIDGFLAQARRAPPALAAYRQEVCSFTLFRCKSSGVLVTLVHQYFCIALSPTALSDRHTSSIALKLQTVSIQVSRLCLL